jgi:hypothetical protein
MEVNDQLHAPPLYPQGKSPWYPLDKRLGGPQRRSESGGGILIVIFFKREDEKINLKLIVVNISRVHSS